MWQKKALSRRILRQSMAPTTRGYSFFELFTWDAVVCIAGLLIFRESLSHEDVQASENSCLSLVAVQFHSRMESELELELKPELDSKVPVLEIRAVISDN